MTDLREAPYLLDDAAIEWVESTIRTSTDEQLVGQLMCVYLRSFDMDEWTSWLAERGIEPGGMMMISRPQDDARRDVGALQSWSRVPLLLAGNLESGGVNFLADTEAFANPMQLAASGDPANAELLAEHCLRLGDDLGINWAFAPVVDVAVNPHNPITHTRAFSDDPDTVARFAERYIRHLEGSGVATSPKHFPGDGVDDRDQHLATTNNDLDADTWRATVGAVYRRVIDAGARTIMVGHIRQPALSRELRPDVQPHEIMPATLAPELIDGVLRAELGFRGMVVSDNSAMTGLTALLPRHEALPRMIEAGIDMVLGNLDVAEDFEILVGAVRSGRITRSRLEESARRVLGVKASMGLHERVDRRGRNRPDPAEEAEWRRAIAEQSVTLVKDTQQLLPLSPARHRRALVYVIGDAPTFYDPTPPLAPHFVDGLRTRGVDVEVRPIPGNSTTPLEAEHLHERFDVCIYFSALRFIGNQNLVRVAWSPWQGHDAPRHVASLPTVLVSVADPYQLQDMPMIRTAINGYTPTKDVVEATLKVLFGEIAARGTSPIDPFAGRWDAAL